VEARKEVVRTIQNHSNVYDYTPSNSIFVC
jgi:hypothetical protein